MAEAAVCFVIDKLIFLLTDDRVRGTLASLWSGGGVQDQQQFRDIKDELESMRSFLRDSESRIDDGEADSGFTTWVKQVRELAFRIEDIVEEHMSHVGSDEDDRLCASACRLFSCGGPWNLAAEREVASKIDEMKRLVREMKERSDRYILGDGSSGKLLNGGVGVSTWHRRLVVPLFVQDAELVGIEGPKNDLLRMLHDSSAKRTVVVSVVGMGGLGKTTICKKVYDNQQVVDCFECRAWIEVSQTYSREELLRRIARQFLSTKWDSALEGSDKMEEVMLIARLREYLSTKRYLVVFDDVWDTEFWEHAKVVFPDKGKGNRVVITTRNEYVAPSPRASQFQLLYHLQALPPGKAFELYCNKAFSLEGGECPPELKQYSETIVERCGGLPLALVVIGGLSGTKEKTVPVWRKLVNDLRTLSTSDQQLTDYRLTSSISKVLSLSYLDLPYHLKSCFLILGLFPEDYPISCSRLVRLWMAEGIVRRQQGVEPEEVAEQYLNELILRNLIQVEGIQPGEKEKYCRLHDLMRDVILSRSNELNLVQVSLTSCRTFKGKGRHLSVHEAATNIPGSSSLGSSFQTHTIIFFATRELPRSVFLAIFQHMKLLKSLDLEGAPVSVVPKEVGDLWHLKYLNLKCTQVKELPRSIGKLSNLETLDLRDTLVIDMPFAINKLIQLRYLLAYCYNYDHKPEANTMRGFRYQGSIGCLEALQELGYIEADRCPDLMKDLEKLVQLRSLLILKLKREDGNALCGALEKMVNLQRLNISSADANEFLELDSLSCPPPFLEYLTLSGPLAKLPHWLPKLQSLRRLFLLWSGFGDGMVESISNLHDLQELRIYDYKGQKLNFVEGSFEKLKELHLRQVSELVELTIEEGALPHLHFLRFGPSPRLHKLPLQLLKSLKTLQLYDIHSDLALGMLPDGGDNHWRIKHVESVTFTYQNRGRMYDTYQQGNPELKRRLQTGITNSMTSEPRTRTNQSLSRSMEHYNCLHRSSTTFFFSLPMLSAIALLLVNSSSPPKHLH